MTSREPPSEDDGSWSNRERSRLELRRGERGRAVAVWAAVCAAFLLLFRLWEG